MWEQLKAYQDKEIVLGLANGTTVAGKVLEVERQLVRLETGKGTVAIPASAVQNHHGACGTFVDPGANGSESQNR